MLTFNVFIMASHRYHVIEIQAHFLKRVKNKSKIKIHILANSPANPIYHKECKQLNDLGISCQIVEFPPGLNYMQKIDYALACPGDYSVKLDEDLWFNENVWDWLIDHASILDNPKNLCLAPILSNGIPTCDMFIDDFMPRDARNELNEMIRSTHIDNFWGVDYSILNQATTDAKTWDSEKFYNLVSKINHFYKGIHPVRINFLLNRRLNEHIIDNWDKLINVPYASLYAQEITRPYMCNSVFMIKTELWRRIIGEKSLFKDSFDEVPLNIYREQNDLNWVFVRNGFGFHIIYNTVEQHEYEKQFITQCLNLLQGEK